MKRLAVLLAAVVVAGCASPLLAGTPDDQVFYVRVYENGKVKDWGFLVFLPPDHIGYARLETYWFGKGAWKEGGNWGIIRDYGSWGCSWEGWYDSVIPAPYDEFEGGYYTPWGDPSEAIVFGLLQPLNEDRDLWFYGEVFIW